MRPEARLGTPGTDLADLAGRGLRTPAHRTPLPGFSAQPQQWWPAHGH